MRSLFLCVKWIFLFYPITSEECSSEATFCLGLYFVKYLMTRTKNIGTKKIARTVADNIPPITQIPISLRPAAPAPVLTANGRTPSMNANEVIRIGRRRILEASTTESVKRCPLSYNSFANSTISMAFQRFCPRE